MRSRAWVALCAAGLLVGLRAAAVDPDARGWTRGGVVAAQSAQLMAGHASRDEVELPRDVVKKVEAVGSQSGKTSAEVIVADSGEM